MSGVWQFSSKGVVTLVENPLADRSSPGPSAGYKILLHNRSNQVVSSYDQLDPKLLELGWRPYASNQYIRQYHRSGETADLITLPRFFGNIRTNHMYDIVVKTRSAFRVKDL